MWDGYEEQADEHYQEVVEGSGAPPREADLNYLLCLHLHLDGLIFNWSFDRPLLQTGASQGPI